MRKRLGIRRKFYITLALFAGFDLAFFGATLSILPGQIDASAEAYRTNRTELDRLLVSRSQLAELERTFLSKREAVEDVRDTLYDPSKGLVFIRLLEETARRTNLTLNLSPLSFSGSAFGSSIILEGTYNNVLRFITLVEHMKPSVDISGITIQKIGTAPTEVEGVSPESLVRATISFTVYPL